MKLKETNFSFANGKFHLNDTWTIHTQHTKLEYEEKKKFN